MKIKGDDRGATWNKSRAPHQPSGVHKLKYKKRDYLLLQLYGFHLELEVEILPLDLDALQSLDLALRAKREGLDVSATSAHETLQSRLDHSEHSGLPSRTELERIADSAGFWGCLGGTVGIRAIIITFILFLANCGHGWTRKARRERGSRQRRVLGCGGDGFRCTRTDRHRGRPTHASRFDFCGFAERIEWRTRNEGEKGLSSSNQTSNTKHQTLTRLSFLPCLPTRNSCRQRCQYSVRFLRFHFPPCHPPYLRHLPIAVEGVD